MIPDDFNKFREDYDGMSFQDLSLFYDKMYDDHPVQQHFSKEAVSAFLYEIGPSRRIIELGGWDGELARKMLDLYPQIEHWTNLEICRKAACSGSAHDGYSAPILEKPVWGRDWPGSVVIASHVFEHLSLRDVRLFLASCPDAEFLYADVPDLPESGTWNDSTSTHVSTSHALHRTICRAGFFEFFKLGTVRLYER